MDIDAIKFAVLTGVSRQSIIKIYSAIRTRFFDLCSNDEIEPFIGDPELDESYFGTRRVRGRLGCGTLGKAIVFGLLKRNGDVKVYLVNNCSNAELLPFIKEHIAFYSNVYTDGFKT